ncbi:MAG TPA: nucleotidyltransferase family protein [Methylophilus sp.]
MGVRSQTLPAVTGILLAAGFSRRFGKADKLLQPMAQGVPMALMAANKLHAVLPRSIAVVRADNLWLAQALADLGLQVVLCEADQTEMADSLRLGIRHAAESSGGTAGYVVALADMPFLQTDTIDAIAQAVQQGGWIVRPVYQGQAGHPVGFSAKLTAELLAIHGDQGARTVLQQHAARVQSVACEDAGILRDIDTVSDLAAALAQAMPR